MAAARAKNTASLGDVVKCIRSNMNMVDTGVAAEPDLDRVCSSWKEFLLDLARLTQRPSGKQLEQAVQSCFKDLLPGVSNQFQRQVVAAFSHARAKFNQSTSGSKLKPDTFALGKLLRAGEAAQQKNSRQRSHSRSPRRRAPSPRSSPRSPSPRRSRLRSTTSPETRSAPSKASFAESGQESQSPKLTVAKQTREEIEAMYGISPVRKKTRAFQEVFKPGEEIEILDSQETVYHSPTPSKQLVPKESQGRLLLC